MKNLSVKAKITLWFAVFMILLSVSMLGLISGVSHTLSRRDTEEALLMRVEANTEAIDYRSGRLNIHNDFLTEEDGIYSVVLDDEGNLLIGSVEDTAILEMDLADDELRSVVTESGTYLVYDLKIRQPSHQSVWVRGYVQSVSSTMRISTIYTASLIILPILLISAIAGGYILSGRVLSPIQDISKTASDISQSGDLSRRIHLTGNSQDELHQLADTFNGMMDRLESNFEAEKRFTSDASHELRNPTAVILAQCEYAKENASTKEEVLESVAAIEKQGNRIKSLIESLLQFTRLSQKTVTVKKEDINLSLLVNRLIDEQTIPEDILVKREIDPDLPLETDEVLLSRLIENLLTNAVKYNSHPGSLTVSLHTENNIPVLIVKDTGAGISKEDLPHIFERFYRADVSRNHTRTEGYGLGLSIVKEIADLFGYTVSVESTLNEGTSFKVTFKS